MVEGDQTGQGWLDGWCVATAADASGDLQSDNGLLGMVGLSQFLYAIRPNRRRLHGWQAHRTHTRIHSLPVGCPEQRLTAVQSQRLKDSVPVCKASIKDGNGCV